MKNSNGFKSFIAHKTVTGSVVRRHTCFFWFFATHRLETPYLCLSVFVIRFSV